MNDLHADKQNTLAREFSLTGKGLHTGLVSTVTFRPASDNTGYKIRRIDLPGQPIIDAYAENVVSTNRGTVLSLNDVQVGTVEHALAALYANSIDNCLIDVDAPEFPILDGSSIEYVNKILECGIHEQTANREYYIPKKAIEYHDEVSGTRILLTPAEKFSIYTQISFDSVILDVQNANLNELAEFNQEIAMCRTFVFVREIEMLLKNGLIKGGDLDNAIVIYDRPVSQSNYDRLADMIKVEKRDAKNLGYIMNKPLRFSNEPARHKLLDILGDISLIGKFIKGTIISVRPGHKANNMFARAIREDMKKTSTVTIKETV